MDSIFLTPLVETPGGFELVVFSDDDDTGKESPAGLGPLVMEHVVMGAGDDSVRTLNGDDILEGGPGHDTLDGGGENDLLLGGSGRDELAGGTGDDDLDGGVGNDGLYGQSGADLLFGRGGSDLLQGQNGNDTMKGGADRDILEGGAGDDDMFGGAGADRMAGGGGKDLIVGGGGKDKLNGGGGKDLLIGGAGNDTMIGGKGADVFLVESDGQRDGRRDVVADLSEADQFVLVAMGEALITADNIRLVETGRGTKFFHADGMVFFRDVTAEEVAQATVIDNGPDDVMTLAEHDGFSFTPTPGPVDSGSDWG